MKDVSQLPRSEQTSASPVPSSRRLQPLARQLVTRLERIRDLSRDLASELTRPGSHTDVPHAMAAAIKHDIDAVLRALDRLQR